MVDEGAEHIGSRDDFKETMIFLQDWKSADISWSMTRMLSWIGVEGVTVSSSEPCRASR